jgi:hypothetical protein
VLPGNTKVKHALPIPNSGRNMVGSMAQPIRIFGLKSMFTVSRMLPHCQLCIILRAGASISRSFDVSFVTE